MSNLSIEPYLDRFRTYVRKWYSTDDSNIIKNVKLKEEHSYRVRYIISELSKLVNASPKIIFLAEIVGLFHDIARFYQFYHFQTFDDRKSFDHANKGVEILKTEGILNDISPEDRERIFSAIKYHNKKILSVIQDPTELLLAKLIRDADKIDIWYIVGKELYNNEDPVISLGYSGGSKYNPTIIDNILNGHVVDYKNVRSTIDFKLTTLAWIYDINFPETLQLIKRKQVLTPIIESLPKIPEINKVVRHIEQIIQQK